jgi:short-subunit dehydrogenase
MLRDGYLDNLSQEKNASSLETFPKMALVTGASSGLGAEFARQLAARGYDLVLAARRLERLQALGEALQTEYGVNAQAQQADLSDMTGIEQLVSIIHALPRLDLLLNNAGFGTVGRFHRVDEAKELAMVNVHMVAPVMLCRAALPGMLARNQGAIINVASLAGLIPIRNVLYFSTKAFLTSFSEALRTELRGSTVRLQALCPGFILTEFHDTREYIHFSRQSIPSFLWMTPEQVASASLKALERNQFICIPGKINHFASLLARNTITAFVIKSVAQYILYHRRRPPI